MMTVTGTNTITIHRVYDAPLKAVWDAWANPKKTANWWGPRGFTLTSHSKNLKPGGNWLYTMHGPDGTDYPNKMQYLEVQDHAKLVYDHGGHNERPPLFRVTALFSETKGKTHLGMTMSFPTAEAAEETRKFIKQVGGDATWDRLAEYLEKELSGKEKFFINRVFGVSREKMFRVWTDPKELAQWLPPQGAQMEFIRADIRPNGSSFYFMNGSGKPKMYGRAHYMKVEKPSCLVYAQQFCDEHEKPSRHPMSPTWPETMLTTITLTEENPDQTRTTVTWEPYGNVNPEEIETFVKSRAGMTQGWTGSFDKLEAYLKSQ